MRILHTSDWHLGDHLGRIDRTADQLRAMDQIMAYCEQERVDVLLIAGDLFNQYRGEALKDLMNEVAQRLYPLLKRGMNAICISGNHDHDYFFALLNTVQALSGDESARRIRFSGQRQHFRLSDPSGAFDVQFVVAPYPLPYKYLAPKDVNVHGLSIAERHQRVANAFSENIAAVQAELDPGLPSVLVSHVYVRTAETSGKGFRLTDDDDYPIEPLAIPAWTYTALGHIHKPQAIVGRQNVRYCGSPERLDFGEREDDKSCVLIDIGPAGLSQDPALMPINSTPIYAVDIVGQDGMVGLAERYPDHNQALVKLQMVWEPGVDNPAAMLQDLGRLFPRYYSQSIHAVTGAEALPNVIADSRDVGATVRTFLAERLAEHPRQKKLMAAADVLIEEVKSAAAQS